MTHIKIYILGEGITAKALRAFVKQYDYVVEVALKEADLVVASPGIAPSKYPKCDCPIISEIEFAYRMFHHPLSQYQPKLVGITGTNGKSSVTHFCAQASGYPAAGNIGVPLISFVNHPKAYPWLIVELSSYQLYGCEQFVADVAVFTSFCKDHLAWHGSLEAYRASKLKLISKDQSQCVLSSESCVNDLPELKQVEHLKIVKTQDEHEEAPRHLVDNLSLSNAILKHIAPQKPALPLNQAKALNLSHRLAPLSINDTMGRLFVNDSKSTNPQSSLAAIDSFAKPVVLILCGEDKKLDLRSFFTRVLQSVKAVIVFGDLAAVLKVYLDQNASSCDVVFVTDLKEAVMKGLDRTKANDVLLFSPSSSSYDHFEGFEQRGDAFEAQLKETLELSCGH